MIPKLDLAQVRWAYARQLVGLLGIEDNRLERAFATVGREHFLGSGPWRLRKWPGGFVTLPSNDPVYLYQDVLVSLDAQRGVNNGSPSLHARMLSALAPNGGETIAHIGAGAGYYSAILAELVGPQGHVLAVEFDADLAKQAATNLTNYDNVEVVHGDGAAWPQSDVDGVYVNFGVARPADAWVERLRSKGRLVFPLSVSQTRPGPKAGTGFVLRVVKSEEVHPVQAVCPASFVTADGPNFSNAEDETLLSNAFKGGGIEFVKSLWWDHKADPQRCWFTGSDWSLSYDEPA